MASVAASRCAWAAAVLWVLNSQGPLHAQLAVGTWVQQSGPPETAALTMTIEPCCQGGYRITYRLNGRNDFLMTIDSPFDGTDAPVMLSGKPTSETMGIKRVDPHHSVSILKMNGQVFGKSSAELSADGRTLTVENEITSATGGRSIGKRTDIWVRK